MFRVTSLAKLPSDQQLDRLIRRVGLILLVAAIAFVAFYAFDRWRPAAPSMVDREITRLETAVREAPEDVALRGQLADTYAIAGRYDEAIVLYGQILETGKADELAYFGRARAYQQLGELDSAVTDFLAVVEIAKGGEMAHVDPTLNVAYYSLGEIALAQEKTTDAITYLTQAIAIKRSDADALNLLGTAYVRNGEPDKAIEPLRNAIAFVPLGWSEPYLTLAEAYAATGDPARAEWANAMADLSSDNPAGAETRLLAIVDGPLALDASIGLGLINEMRGDTLAAADWYRKALAVDPENAEARLGLTRVALPDASAAPLPDLPAPGQVDGGTGQ
jgi:tetratricopeptide (TPR) repeat protein